MLTIEPIKIYSGFGNGATQNECYYSQGMMKSDNGIMTGLSIIKAKDNSAQELPTLGTIQWMVQGIYDNLMQVYGIDENGYIYRAPNGVNWALLYQSSKSISLGHNGQIIDQKGRLIYVGWRYVGMYDGTADYATGTVAVNYVSPVVTGTGTNFTAGMVGKRFRVSGSNSFYTIQSVDSTTQITLTQNYAEVSGSGKSFTIYDKWTDGWKDLGAEHLISKPTETYEDWTMIGYNNKIALINTIDDSFNADGFTLPAGFVIDNIKSGKTGVLIGANFNNQSIVALWDCYSDRSIAPWIWFDVPVKSIIKYKGNWLVITNNGIYLTNGYTITSIKEEFLNTNLKQNVFSSLLAQGASVLGEKLLYWSTEGLAKDKFGIYILDIGTKKIEFASVSNGVTYNGSGGVIFIDSNLRIHLSFSTDNPSKNIIAGLFNATPLKAQYIVEAGRGDNNKIAHGIGLNIGISSYEYVKNAITFNLSAKIYNYERQLWGFAVQKQLGTQLNKITINGIASDGHYSARVGDEVTILEGLNAGEVRHIIAITDAGEDPETWTLDSNLPYVVEANVTISVSPFELIKKYTYSDLSELKEVYFNIQNRTKGKRYLLKFTLDNMAVPIEIKGGQFIYDNL
jgi:hypothetical protein